METHSYDVQKSPRQRETRRFLSVGQISRRWDIPYDEILQMADRWGWSTRKDVTTGWKDWYRQDQVERAMSQIGAAENGQ